MAIFIDWKEIFTRSTHYLEILSNNRSIVQRVNSIDSKTIAQNSIRILLEI